MKTSNTQRGMAFRSTHGDPRTRASVNGTAATITPASDGQYLVELSDHGGETIEESGFISWTHAARWAAQRLRELAELPGHEATQS